ncbi:unnamed protein product [Brassica rapa]|uniref:Uncharacterized protein n=2 Tax=Brassica TaxID=3705 RepID=A0A8D9GBA9_BRACM|nr:unnamed protein product [Brassica napus]CAG7874904.1 unnamed protein product [Brassica rapa]
MQIVNHQKTGKKKVIVVVKNLFGFDGVTGSDKDGERCRRKERFSKSVKAGLQFPVVRSGVSIWTIWCSCITFPPFSSSLPLRLILDLFLSLSIIYSVKTL